MEKKHYVYIYLDPRNPGKYKYRIEDKILELDYEPIYVGKGFGDRYVCHWHYFIHHPNDILKKN